MPNAQNVLIGAPDQATTGAIANAPLGTALPESTSTALNEAFVKSGYVSSDGLALTPEYNTNQINDWSGANVRTILSTFNGTLSWTEIEMSYEAACHAFGSDHVEKTPADTTHGTQLKISLGAHLPKVSSWVFNIKDGDARVRVVVPKGQPTAIDAINFNANNAIGLPITLSAYPDEHGESIYIYTDDGVVSA